jgi:hypothetical protein
MSGCFRSKYISDKDALLWVLTHSTVSVLSNESSNALLLYLVIKKQHIKNSPYLRIYFSFSKHKIVQEPLKRMVIKLTPLYYEKNDIIPSRKAIDNEKILVENQVIHITTQEGWQHEVHVQKYAFYHTYMIDMQMQAVCPNVLCSWKIIPSNIHYFLSLIDIADSSQPIKRKFKTWEYGEVQERLFLDKEWVDKPTTHLKTIIDFFRKIYHYHQDLQVGCMLMEYLDDVNDMVEYPCVMGHISNISKNLGTTDEYFQYLYGKAYGLIQYDKCRSIGIEHDDLHWGNMVTYKNPENDFVSAVIDFGISHHSEPFNDRCKRLRPFYNHNSNNIHDEEYDEEPYQKYVYKKYSYLGSLINTNDKLKEWTDITRKIGPQSKRYDYVPIELMNKIDKDMVKRGRTIYSYLFEKVKTHKT